jgi:hypothetical protein
MQNNILGCWQLQLYTSSWKLTKVLKLIDCSAFFFWCGPMEVGSAGLISDIFSYGEIRTATEAFNAGKCISSSAPTSPTHYNKS